MPILFNNDSANEKKPEQETTQSSMPSPTPKNENSVVISKEDDFAIFPQWDVNPPNSIINPRLKKKI